MVLISGCSFLQPKILDTILQARRIQTKNVACSGAGNRYIADSIMDHYDSTIDTVYVFFSGLHRVDITIPKDLAEIIIDDYKFHSTLKNTTYLFSGGQAGTWSGEETESEIKELFKSQYKTFNLNYLAENSLLEVAKCLNFLESKKIKYKWSFIYDIFHNYENDKAEHSLGHIDKDFHALRHINWDHYIDLTMYEFGIDNGYISDDEFHLTGKGCNQYFLKILDQLL